MDQLLRKKAEGNACINKWVKSLTCMDINMKSTKLPIPQNPTVQNFSRPKSKQKVIHMLTKNILYYKASHPNQFVSKNTFSLASLYDHKEKQFLGQSYLLCFFFHACSSADSC